jgi:hypothetical protein
MSDSSNAADLARAGQYIIQQRKAALVHSSKASEPKSITYARDIAQAANRAFSRVTWVTNITGYNNSPTFQYLVLHPGKDEAEDDIDYVFVQVTPWGNARQFTVERKADGTVVEHPCTELRDTDIEKVKEADAAVRRVHREYMK